MLYALTTTAEDFAAARGFQRIARTDVPQAIAALPQFKTLCPKTAVCMRLRVPQST
jgi:N-acetylglutamate synthase-like GNAT family acetyltransferase